jgi:hypothetical protein
LSLPESNNYKILGLSPAAAPDYYRLAERAWDGLPIAQTRQLLDKLSQLNDNIGRIEHQLAAAHE